MYYNEEGYLQLLEKILREGHYRRPVDEDGRFIEEGRNELFAQSLKFDLTDNKLPLFTSKKVFFKSLAGEMLWLLSGSQKTDMLDDMGIGIWNIWKNEKNVIGPLYGSLATDWRADPSILLPIEPKIKEYKPPIPPQDRMVAELQESIDGEVYESTNGGEFIIIADEGRQGTTHKYTIQFLNTGYIKKCVQKGNIDTGKVKDLYAPTASSIGYIGEIINPTKIDSKLRKTWEYMLSRCYNKEDTTYKYYGAKGVFVDPEWHNFANFQRDVQKISGWCRKLDMPELYELDKDYWGSNHYSKDTCVWLNHYENSLYRKDIGKSFSATHEDGTHVPVHLNQRRFAIEHNLDNSCVSKCLRGERPQHKGWTFKYLEDGKIYRPGLPVNQIEKVMKSLRDKPEARSHIVSMWKPDVMPLQSIKACHILLQFYRLGDEVSLSLTIRSSDYFIGFPFNVAQYALLTHLVAAQLGCRAKELTVNLGDTHIYENCFDQAYQQLTQPVLEAPTLKLKRLPEDIFDYTLDDFEIVGYAHADYLPAEISPQGTPGKCEFLV